MYRLPDDVWCKQFAVNLVYGFIITPLFVASLTVRNLIIYQAATKVIPLGDSRSSICKRALKAIKKIPYMMADDMVVKWLESLVTP